MINQKEKIMKKLITVSLLGVLLSIPSVVFAEASWYGSIKTGIQSSPSVTTEADPDATPPVTEVKTTETGVADFGSRWGIRGSSEVSEGLTAVYNYETAIDSTDASAGDGRLSYVGLSGGFGTITIGHIWGAAYNHFGGIVDQAQNYGSSGPAGARFSNALSYSVSVGNVSLQADALMDQSTVESGDGFNFGATLGGLMETGSIAIAHRKFADMGSVSRSASFIAGNYGIGDMTVFLGYSQGTFEQSDCTAASVDATQRTACATKLKSKSIFAGVHGGIGDTGVNYVFTMTKVKSTADGFEFNTNNNNVEDYNNSTIKNNPWTLGLSKSLGGGATLKFEHSEPGSDADATNSDEDSSTAIWLQVDF